MRNIMHKAATNDTSSVHQFRMTGDHGHRVTWFHLARCGAVCSLCGVAKVSELRWQWRIQCSNYRGTGEFPHCGCGPHVKERKGKVFIQRPTAPFVLRIVSKRSDMDHTVLFANYIMHVFPL